MKKFGREAGMHDGIIKEKLQNAKKMRNKGFDIDTIKEITGLTKEEILKL